MTIGKQLEQKGRLEGHQEEIEKLKLMGIVQETLEDLMTSLTEFATNK